MVESTKEIQYIELVTTQLKVKYGFDSEVIKITETYEENTREVTIRAKDDWSTNFTVIFNSSTRLFDDNYVTRVMESRLAKFIVDKMQEKAISVGAQVSFEYLVVAGNDTNEALDLGEYLSQSGISEINVLLYAEEPSANIENYSDSLLLAMIQIATYAEVPVNYKTYFFSKDKFQLSVKQLGATDLSDVNPLSFMPVAEVFVAVDGEVTDVTSFELSNILKQ